MYYLRDACDAARTAVPERDLQKMDGRKIALGHGLSNPRGRTWWNFPHLVQWSNRNTTQGTQCLSPISKFGAFMTVILLQKRLSCERWKHFESLGYVVKSPNSLGRTNPETKKGGFRKAWRMRTVSQKRDSRGSATLKKALSSFFLFDFRRPNQSLD